MIAAALAALDAPLPVVDADLAADFLALGYAHYVTETITVNIRYMNSLDEAGLERELLAAATSRLFRRKRRGTRQASGRL